MATFRRRWAAALFLAALSFTMSRPLRAADGRSGTEVLKKHGFRIAGSLVVADLESELKAKLSEVRRLAKQLSYSRARQQGTMSPEERQQNIKAAGEQINQLKAELAAVNQQLARVPRGNSRFGSRYGGNSFSNTDAAEMFAELTYYKNQLQMELNQDSQFLGQLKSQPADAKAKDKIDAEVRGNREAYHQALLDLRKLVDQTRAKYDEALTSAEIKNALELVGKRLPERPKLGPSHEFLTEAKLVDKLEKAESSGEVDEHPAHKARRGRGKTSGKNLSKTPSGTGDGAS